MIHDPRADHFSFIVLVYLVVVNDRQANKWISLRACLVNDYVPSISLLSEQPSRADSPSISVIPWLLPGCDPVSSCSKDRQVNRLISDGFSTVLAPLSHSHGSGNAVAPTLNPECPSKAKFPYHTNTMIH